uniref:AAA domain-containing protein n=1 Tax=Panagrellus redivivus TaxID=6233 RepID=A0A7E4VUZ8_PANRE
MPWHTFRDKRRPLTIPMNEQGLMDTLKTSAFIFMPSVWSSLPTLSKNVEVKLFPRESRRGRSRSLRIEADTGIKASFASKSANFHDESDDAYDSGDESCLIPCSLVGVDGAAKKPIRLRFNPEVLKSAESDAAIQEAVKKTTFMMLEEHLSSEYVLDPADRIDPKQQLLTQLESIFTGRAPALEISAENQLSLVWPVNPTDLISPAEAKKQLTSPARRIAFLEQFFVKVSDCLSVIVLPGRGTPKPDYGILGALLKPTIMPTSQIVEVVVDKKGLFKKLLSIELMAFPRLDDSATHSFHRVEFSERDETIRLELMPRNSRSRRSSWVAPDAFVAIGSTKFAKDGDSNWMIDCAHLRVQELRPELSATLRNYPKVMTTRDLSDIDPDKTITAASTAPASKVDVVYVSTSAVMVKVDPLTPRRSSLSSRFQVSPTSNAPPPRRSSTPSGPLHVDANLSAPVSTNVISPSESIDSGVASPGAMSDIARFRASEEHVVRGLKLRDRSASECFPQQYSVPSVPGLKGILKKPKWHFGSAPSDQGNALRRSPATSRLLYARSVSECVDGADFDEDYGNMSISASTETIASSSPPQENLMFRVDEEDENTESGLNTAEDSDSADATTPPATVMRKKRVSFSEHVQARIYRSNSSVAGRDKRKKQQQRVRRGSGSGSESGDESPIVESIVEDAFSMTASEQAFLGEVAKEISAANAAFSGPESPSKRAARITSTDSAIGDEEDDGGYDEEVDVCLETLRVA